MSAFCKEMFNYLSSEKRQNKTQLGLRGEREELPIFRVSFGMCIKALQLGVFILGNSLQIHFLQHIPLPNQQLVAAVGLFKLTIGRMIRQNFHFFPFLFEFLLGEMIVSLHQWTRKIVVSFSSNPKFQLSFFQEIFVSVEECRLSFSVLKKNGRLFSEGFQISFVFLLEKTLFQILKDFVSVLSKRICFKMSSNRLLRNLVGL